MADLPSFRATEIAIGDVPTAPAGKVFVFIDAADKHLKTKDDAGTVVDLTVPGPAGLTGLTGDVGGTTTGSPVTISGGVHFGVIRAADVISLPINMTFLGSVRDVGVGATNVHTWGSERSDVIPLIIHRSGRVRVVSTSLSTAITAGTLDLQVTVNGIAQTAETLLLSSPSKNGSLIFATPIELAIGDELNLQTVTDGAFSPSTDDTLSFMAVEMDP